MFEPRLSLVACGSSTSVSPTGQTGELGSDEAGATVSNSGGAEAVAEAGSGDAAAEVADEAPDAVAVPLLSRESDASRSSTAGRACESNAQ